MGKFKISKQQLRRKKQLFGRVTKGISKRGRAWENPDIEETIKNAAARKEYGKKGGVVDSGKEITFEEPLLNTTLTSGEFYTKKKIKEYSFSHTKARFLERYNIIFDLDMQNRIMELILNGDAVQLGGDWHNYIYVVELDGIFIKVVCNDQQRYLKTALPLREKQYIHIWEFVVKKHSLSRMVKKFKKMYSLNFNVEENNKIIHRIKNNKAVFIYSHSFYIKIFDVKFDNCWARVVYQKEECFLIDLLTIPDDIKSNYIRRGWLRKIKIKSRGGPYVDLSILETIGNYFKKI